MKDANNLNKEKLPIDARPHQNAHRKQVMADIVSTKNTDSNKRRLGNDSDKLAEGLQEP